MAKAVRGSVAAWDEKRQRWCCRVMREGKRRAFYSSTPGRRGKREAERKADEWIESSSVDSVSKFHVVWQGFLEYYERMHGEKNSTYQQHNKNGRLYILPLLEHKRLEDIRPIDWQSCITSAFAASREKGKPLSAKTLKNIRGSLTSFRNYCDDLDIQLPSMRKLRIPDAATEKERTILQPETITLLFSPPKHTATGKEIRAHYLHMWRFEVLTGLRPGEICALMHSDITEDYVVTIRRSVNVYDIVTEGKNKNAWRSFKLPQRAIDVLNDQRDYLHSIGMSSPYVFPSADGDIASERTVYAMWRRYCEKQGIPKCSLYELRHTMISVNTDIPDAILKPIAGHSRNMDTRGIYGHELHGTRERAAKMIDDAFSFLDTTQDAKPK